MRILIWSSFFIISLGSVQIAQAFQSPNCERWGITETAYKDMFKREITKEICK